MNSPIIICGCTKSGTTLLRSLFDGHPRLLVIPFETHYFQQIKYQVLYPFRQTAPDKLTMEQRKQELVRWLEFTNRRSNRVADGFVARLLNTDKAREVLFGSPTPSVRALCDQYVAAIAAGLGLEGGDSREFVEKSVENAEFAADWRELYPDARFIHILRNPYSNLVALRRYLSVVSHGSPRGFPSLRTALGAMQQSFYFMYRNLRLIPGYHVIRYEALVSNPESVMREACVHLGLPFEYCLLAPSILGGPWGGNSTSGRSFNGISAATLDRWQGKIKPIEIALVNKFFAHVLADFGYERLRDPRSTSLPVRGESLRHYLVNRMLLRRS